MTYRINPLQLSGVLTSRDILLPVVVDNQDILLSDHLLPCLPVQGLARDSQLRW